jgi:hypothetical protein
VEEPDVGQSHLTCTTTGFGQRTRVRIARREGHPEGVPLHEVASTTTTDIKDTVTATGHLLNQIALDVVVQSSDCVHFTYIKDSTTLINRMAQLEQDYTTVPGQIFACISLVGPECPQKNDKFGLKIRGCFNSRDEAASHAKRLQKEDATFDIYVVDMYKWLLIPPDRDHIEDVHYNDTKLEELMTAYRENQSQAAKMFEDRKRDMSAKPVDGSFIKPGDENSKFYSKPDEPPISHPADVLERLKSERPDAPMEELVKEADAIVRQEIEERQREREKNLTVE